MMRHLYYYNHPPMEPADGYLAIPGLRFMALCGEPVPALDVAKTILDNNICDECRRMYSEYFRTVNGLGVIDGK